MWNQCQVTKRKIIKVRWGCVTFIMGYCLIFVADWQPCVKDTIQGGTKKFWPIFSLILVFFFFYYFCYLVVAGFWKTTSLTVLILGNLFPGAYVESHFYYTVFQSRKWRTEVSPWHTATASVGWYKLCCKCSSGTHFIQRQLPESVSKARRKTSWYMIM